MGAGTRTPGVRQAGGRLGVSSLPNSGSEIAEEWLARAGWRYTTGLRVLSETGDTKEAVRDFASSVELALKAVYIKLGTTFPRTHSVWELVEGCPERSVEDVLGGYSERFLKEFSRNYLAPYVRARPVPADDIEQCRRFSDRVLGWAAGVVKS